MFNFLKKISINRTGWFIVFVSALLFEVTGLYFQHIMHLNPCVMCIYERVAFLAIAFSGVVGMLAPRLLILRLLAIAVGLAGAIKGLRLAVEHVGYQLNPSPWNQCPLMVDFPQQFPLDQWFPQIFQATGSCSEITWQLFNLSIPQWLIGIFAVYIVLFLLVLLSQLKRYQLPQHRSLFR